MYLCVRARVCVCARERERETDRQTDRQTDIQAETQSERETETERQRQTETEIVYNICAWRWRGEEREKTGTYHVSIGSRIYSTHQTHRRHCLSLFS